MPGAINVIEAVVAKESVKKIAAGSQIGAVC